MMEAVRRSARVRTRVKPYLYILPMSALALLFVYYPFVKTVIYSLSVVNAKGEIVSFAGLSNFAYLFGRREFKAALSNTHKVFYTAGFLYKLVIFAMRILPSTTANWILGLMYAK